MDYLNKLSINDAIEILRNEKCPHQRRIACSTCEWHDECNASETLTDFTQYNVIDFIKVISEIDPDSYEDAKSMYDKLYDISQEAQNLMEMI